MGAYNIHALFGILNHANIQHYIYKDLFNNTFNHKEILPHSIQWISTESYDWPD